MKKKKYWLYSVLVPATILFSALIASLGYYLSNLLNSEVPLLGCALLLLVLGLISGIVVLIINRSSKSTIKEINDIKSYRVFNNMQITFYVAVLLGIFLYFAIGVLSDTKDLSTYILETSIFYGGLIVLTILEVAIFSKFYLGKYNRMLMFILGITINLTFNILVSLDVIKIKWLYYLCNAVGTSLMLSATLLLHQTLGKVIQYVADKESKNMAIVDFRNLLIALVFSSIIASATIIVLFLIYGSNIPYTSDVLLFLPTIFMFITLWLAAMEPIDGHYLKLLEDYIHSGIDDDNIKEKVKYNLVYNFVLSTRRVGFKILVLFLRPFFKMKVLNKKVVNTKNGPVVFVSNHYEIYGPIVTVLRLPFNFRPWVISSMLNKEQIQDQMRLGSDNIFKKMPKRMKNWFINHCSNIVLKCIEELRPVPVYRDSIKDVVKTMRKSVDVLTGGDNLLIFPEKTDKYKEDGSVDPFYSGFAYIGEMYYKKTGKNVTFYPVYLCKKNKTMSFGEGITYDSSNESDKERERVSHELYLSMVDLQKKQEKSMENKKKKGMFRNLK